MRTRTPCHPTRRLTRPPHPTDTPLHANSPPPNPRRVHAAPRGQTCAVSGLYLRSDDPTHTRSTPQPLNTAQPSPDGRWVAVGRDDTCVVLLPSGEG